MGNINPIYNDRVRYTLKGIYKITNPNGKIYIGQSIDIERRFIQYKKLKCKKQPILYRSFLKYGVDKHKFEILCECETDELNNKERFYQDLFSVLENGLNCRLTIAIDRSGELSKQTKIKIGLSHKNRIHSNESRKNMSISHIGNVVSNETRIKISKSSKGRIISEETRNKIRLFNLKREVTPETRDKIRKSLLGNKMSEESKLKKSKLLLDVQTGVFYYSVREASNIFKIPYSTLKKKLCGIAKNNTNLIYV